MKQTTFYFRPNRIAVTPYHQKDSLLDLTVRNLWAHLTGSLAIKRTGREHH